MKKIPCIFKIDHVNHCTTSIINPECQWVFDGEGIAQRKWDGTACRILDGKLYKRRQVKKGKASPVEFLLCETDPNTGNSFGWVPCVIGPEDKWHWEGFDNACRGLFLELGEAPENGTYELCGPQINGNPEKLEEHALINHSLAGGFPHPGPPVTVSFPHMALKSWLFYRDIEGIVFKHPDGRMAKIRKTDFGLER